MTARESQLDKYAIQTSELTKVFEKKTKGEASKKEKKEKIYAADHIELLIKEGELFGLLGPNGAGKTTTIKLLCTLLVPDEGTAIVNGYDVVKESDKVRKSIGIVMGGERALYWRLTGRENLWFFSQLYNIPGKIAKERINQLLKLVELEDRADDEVERYSRGMKQRLHIIRGLVNDPPTLLLDEPTLGLDPASARVIRDFIKKELQKKQSKTILLTTHYMEEADQLCDRIAIIDQGKIIALDTPENLKKNIQEVGIIRIEALNFQQEVEELLRKISGVKEVACTYTESSTTGAIIRIHAEKTEDVLPDVTETLIKNGSRIRVLQETKPTLEDVFIKLTGKRLRD